MQPQNIDGNTLLNILYELEPKPFEKFSILVSLKSLLLSLSLIQLNEYIDTSYYNGYDFLFAHLAN